MSLIDKPKVKILMLKGEKGDSAYQVAVNNGYAGTEEEWKDSYINAETYYNKNEVDAKLKKKVYYFDTVALMKSSTDLVEGDLVITKGYYIANDGGSAYYHIVSETEKYSEDLTNGLKAELIIKESVNVKMFGAKGDGETDDLISLTNAFNNSNTIYFDKGTYNITDNITINNKTIVGNSSIINTISQATTQEHQIIFNGTNNVRDITFKQSNHNVALCLIRDCYNSNFDNCKFIVDNVETNGYVDLYTNNQNLNFTNCIFNCSSYKLDGSLAIGGIWIREYYEDKTTENIHFNNCSILHNSIDECIAIWNWQGSVKDVYIDNCTIKATDTCTSPHFISLDADNCIMNNCNIYSPSVNSNSVIKGTHWCNVNNCNIYSHNIENNGLSSGNIIFNNCKIYNDYEKFYLGVNSINKFYNCEIECNTIVDSRNIELYNCKITTKSENSTDKRMFNKNIIAKNTMFDVTSCKSVFESYFADPLNVDVSNCEFNITTGKFMIINNNANVNNIIKLFNNYIGKGTITAYSGYVASGYIINNISVESLPTSLTGVTIANNTTIGG